LAKPEGDDRRQYRQTVAAHIVMVASFRNMISRLQLGPVLLSLVDANCQEQCNFLTEAPHTLCAQRRFRFLLYTSQLRRSSTPTCLDLSRFLRDEATPPSLIAVYAESGLPYCGRCGS